MRQRPPSLFRRVSESLCGYLTARRRHTQRAALRAVSDFIEKEHIRLLSVGVLNERTSSTNVECDSFYIANILIAFWLAYLRYHSIVIHFRYHFAMLRKASVTGKHFVCSVH